MLRISRFFSVFLLLASFLPLLQAQRRSGGGRASGPGVIPAPSYIPRSPDTLPVNTAAHHADEEGKVEFRSETVLVQVPVVVTDKSGAHVRGLRKDDFEVFENGKAQKISAFEEIETTQAPLKLAPPVKGEISNFDGRGEASRNVTVIAMDTINTPFLDQTYGRKQLIRYLSENIQPGQLISLVAITSHGTKVIHDFTSDTASLIAALNKVKGELSTMENVNADTQAAAATGSDFTYSPLESLSNTGSTDAQLNDFISNGDATIARLQQDRAIEATFSAFQNIALSLSGVPGKKSLIWATGGFPFYFDSPGAIPYGTLGYVYERAIQSLADAEISVYPVDVRGLTNTSLAGDASYSLVGRSGRSTAANQFARNWLLNSSLDSLRDFAEMTGGRAFYNSNDISGGFRRAVDDGSQYYLLSYYLDTTNTKAGWRQLKVKLHKPGTELRARGGFFVTGATTNPEQSRKTDIAFALQSPFDSTGIPLSVRFKDVTSDGQKKKVNYVLHVAPEGITIQGDRGTVNLDVVGIAVKEKRAADDFEQTIEGSFKADMLAKLRTEGLAYNNALELPPGRYTVRFVVRDNFSGKLGSLTAPLTVN